MAEQEEEDVLNALVATGALQQRNWMNIELLLNPEGESHLITKTLDTEIYQSVVNVANAHKNIEINGRDDIADKLLPLKPCLTWSEVLKASLTLQRYAEDVNDPIACRLEIILGSFNVKIHLDQAKSMWDMVVTDFFKKL